MKKALKYTFIGLGIFFLLGIIGAAIGDSSSNTGNKSKSNEPAPPAGSGSSSGSDNSSSSGSSGNSRSYIKLLEFSGNGAKKSTVFELHGNHGRLRYKYRAEAKGMGFFSVYIVPDGENLMETGGIPEVMSSVDHEDSESAIQKSSGKYYLDVNAAGSWSIVIEEEQ